MRKFTGVPKAQSMRLLAFPFRPGMKKNDSDYMDFSARLAGLKFLARFEDTGLGFLARAELRPNPSPCSRQFILKGIVSEAGL